MVMGLPGLSVVPVLRYSPVAQAPQGSRLEGAWSFFSFLPFLAPSLDLTFLTW